ncbi:SRPBCC family protein [Halocynthiibacter styelae]|uniref:SRPBCC family protein n=1 Tax=Halocynthiibacter styelae TaxID=2761955 RepID=UPI001E47D919|nr:SRPBCC family protein [Paenihalocynthiibacter styelae]
MIQAQRSADIKATPEAVWGELSRFMDLADIAPLVASVDALSEASTGLGAKRRCHFDNGTSLVEEAITWEDGRMMEVRMSEMDAMPLHEGVAKIMVEPSGINHCRVIWGLNYRVKYGPLGWILGRTLMKMMMGKVIDGNLKGLADKVAAG